VIELILIILTVRFLVESIHVTFSPHRGAVGSGGGSSGSGPANVLVPGDVVEVVEGDLMNLQGKVQVVEGDTITIIPRHEDLKVSRLYFQSTGCFFFKISCFIS